jgi:hypothetical protein
MSHTQHRSSIIAVAAAALRDPILLPGALLSAGMFMAAGLVPFLGLFLGLFSPVPLLYFYCRRGRSFGLTMCAVAFAAVGLVYVLLGRSMGGLVFGEYCVMAILLGEGLARRFPPGLLVGTASAGILAMAFGVLVLAGIGIGQSPLTLGRNLVEHQVRTSMAMYEQIFQMPSSVPEETAQLSFEPMVEETMPAGNSLPQLTPQGEKLAGAMMAVFPGLMIMGTILVAWANLMMGRSFLARAVTLPRRWTIIKPGEHPKNWFSL